MEISATSAEKIQMKKGFLFLSFCIVVVTFLLHKNSERQNGDLELLTNETSVAPKSETQNSKIVDKNTNDKKEMFNDAKLHEVMQAMIEERARRPATVTAQHFEIEHQQVEATVIYIDPVIERGDPYEDIQEFEQSIQGMYLNEVELVRESLMEKLEGNQQRLNYDDIDFEEEIILQHEIELIREKIYATDAYL